MKIYCKITYINGNVREGYLNDKLIEPNQEIINQITSLMNRADGRVCFEFEFGESVSVNLNNTLDISLRLV